MKTHKLKCWPEIFEAFLDGKKTFDIRLNDRDYQVGDTIKMREWSPDKKDYTGRGMDFNIVYLTNGMFGQLQTNIIVMQLEPAIELVMVESNGMSVKDIIGHFEEKNIKKCKAVVTTDMRGEALVFEIARVLEHK